VGRGLSRPGAGGTVGRGSAFGGFVPGRAGCTLSEVELQAGGLPFVGPGLAG
jgi:hypothetical protein